MIICTLLVAMLSFSSMSNGERTSLLQDSNMILAYSFQNPITITSNADFVAQGFSGQGTEESPFLLSNLNITSHTPICITITDTTSHFIIENCWFSSGESEWQQGLITFENVANALVRNNIFSSGHIAIYVDGGSTCRFQSNQLGTSLMGFLGYDLDDCVFSDNTQITDSMGYPVHIEDSSDMTIRNNLFENCLYEGIGLTSCTDCIIEDNILSGTNIHLGQYAFAIRNSRACSILGNNATNFGTAIDLTEGQFHLVTQNEIYSCWAGIMLRSNDTIVTYNTIWVTGFGIGTRDSFRFEIRNNEFHTTRYVTAINTIEGGDSIISENTINDAEYGIRAQATRNLTISYNYIADCYAAISLEETLVLGLPDEYPENCTIRQNNLEDCGISFSISDPVGMNHIITGNLINGLPLVYHYRETGLELDGDDYGRIILAACEDVSISGGVLDEILVMFCKNCEISGVQISNRTNGIYIRDSLQVAIGYSQLFGNDVGIRIESSNRCQIVRTIAHNNVHGLLLDTTPNATIYDCDLYNNEFGLVLIGAHQSNIESNEIYQNDQGMYLLRTHESFIGNNEFIENHETGLLLNRGSRNNRIISNSFGWNSVNVICSGFENEWDDGTKRGNRWSDLGDSLLYIIDEDDIDRYPSILGDGISTTNSTTTTHTIPTTISDSVSVIVGATAGFSILCLIAAAMHFGNARKSN